MEGYSPQDLSAYLHPVLPLPHMPPLLAVLHRPGTDAVPRDSLPISLWECRCACMLGRDLGLTQVFFPTDAPFTARKCWGSSSKRYMGLGGASWYPVVFIPQPLPEGHTSLSLLSQASFMAVMKT